MRKITYHDGLKKLSDIFKVDPDSIGTDPDNISKVLMAFMMPDLSHEIGLDRITVFDYNVLIQKTLTQEEFAKILDCSSDSSNYENMELKFWVSLPNHQVVCGYLFFVKDGNLNWRALDKSSSSLKTYEIADLKFELQPDGRIQFYEVKYQDFKMTHQLYGNLFELQDEMTEAINEFIQSSNMEKKDAIDTIVNNIIKTSTDLLLEKFTNLKDGMDQEDYEMMVDRLRQILRAKICVRLDNLN